MLTKVAIAGPNKVKAYPRQLSGGQQQRVVTTRALMNEPEVLLADEPTSDLDEQTEHEIMALFQQIHAQTGVTALLVTHSTGLGHYGTRSIQMVAGEIVEGKIPDSYKCKRSTLTNNHTSIDLRRVVVIMGEQRLELWTSRM